MSVDRTDRVLRIILICVAIVTSVTLIVGFITAPYIISGANNSDQVVKGNELQSCRSQAYLKVVDAKTTVDEAHGQYELDLGAAFGTATAKGDVAGALAALQATAADVKARTEALRAATNDYQDQVALSRNDPDQFIDACRKGTL